MALGGPRREVWAAARPGSPVITGDSGGARAQPQGGPREAPGARLRPGLGQALPSWLLPSLSCAHQARSHAGAEEAERTAEVGGSGGLVLGLALPLPERAAGAGPTKLSSGAPWSAWGNNLGPLPFALIPRPGSLVT